MGFPKSKEKKRKSKWELLNNWKQIDIYIWSRVHSKSNEALIFFLKKLCLGWGRWWRWRCSQGFNLSFATWSFGPNVNPVLIKSHWRIKTWPILTHELFCRLNHQITLRVVKESQRDSIFVWVHYHPVLYALVYCIAQDLYTTFE